MHDSHLCTYLLASPIALLLGHRKNGLATLVSSSGLLHVCKLLLQVSLIGVDILKSWYFNLTKTHYQLECGTLNSHGLLLRKLK